MATCCVDQQDDGTLCPRYFFVLTYKSLSYKGRTIPCGSKPFSSNNMCLERKCSCIISCPCPNTLTWWETFFYDWSLRLEVVMILIFQSSIYENWHVCCCCCWHVALRSTIKAVYAASCFCRGALISPLVNDDDNDDDDDGYHWLWLFIRRMGSNQA